MAALSYIGDKQELEGHVALGMYCEWLCCMSVHFHLSQVPEMASKTVQSTSKLQEKPILLHDSTLCHASQLAFLTLTSCHCLNSSCLPRDYYSCPKM